MADLYRAEFTKAAEKQIRKLDKVAQQRILKSVHLLTTNPRPPRAKALVGHPGLLRIRVGDYRIIYSLEDERLIIAIVKIGHRSSIYDSLSALDNTAG